MGKIRVTSNTFFFYTAPSMSMPTAMRLYGEAKLAEVNASLGIAPASAEAGVARTPPTKAARAAQKQITKERRETWTLWMAQGVPLKDPEALIHYGRTFYFGDGQHNMAATIEYVRGLAGGRLPPANISKALTDLASERSEVRLKRNAAMPLDFDSVQSQRRNGVYEKIREEAEKLLISRDFYWRGATKAETGLDCRTGTYVHPNDGRSLSMRYLPQRDGVRKLLVEVAPSWINNIVRKGLIDLAGPDTLTVGIERTHRGDRVTFYHKRPNGNQITLRQGYLSLRGNLRVVVDVTVLKKITFKGVTDGA